MGLIVLIKYLIGLSGHMRSGKDTVAIILKEYGYVRFSFGDHVRRELAEWWKYKPLHDTVIPDKIKHTLYLIQSEERIREAIFQKPTTPEITEALQWWGIYRRWANPFHWLSMVWADMVNHQGGSGRAVISDVRMPNEMDAIQRKGGEVWRIQREPIVCPFASHVTEYALDNYDFDAIIRNNTSIDDLKLLVRDVLRDFDKGAKSDTLIIRREDIDRKLDMVERQIKELKANDPR